MMSEEESLVSIPINLLHEGMELPHDIFNYNGTLMLVPQGSVISESQITAIRRFNKYKDTVVVSSETLKVIQRHKSLNKTVSRQKLEEETGYVDTKDDTFHMLEEIASTSNVSQEAIHSISDSLSKNLEKTKPGLILDLVNALAPMDEYLQRHCANVSLLNGLLGKWMGLEKSQIDLLVLSGLLHDCGKASVPDQVINAPRALTRAEFEVIKMHTVYGYDLLAEFCDDVRYAVRYHHEKINGRGYPDNLLDKQISLFARITAVSDVYDAMVSRRVYKEPQSPFSVLAMLRKLKNTEFDANVVDVFLNNMQKELIGKTIMLSNGKKGIVHEIDLDDIEYPYICADNKLIKTNGEINCKFMYFDEKP
ncbi:MAG: HD-GYP domain-containing protein [Oscillospiraceae bacterium]|nr:HD-GYP domain-containing protein [Oscillospiraceae bacterium]